INWAICDSDWEIELCRILEAHPRVRAYARNQSLGLEVPYHYGSQRRRYLPDFVVLVEDGRGEDDLLNLVLEVKGYRREDAKDKKNAMDAYWVPGVNNLGTHGRWAFAELTNVYAMEVDLDAKITEALDSAIDVAISTQAEPVS
ncbi:MAG TPA: hypothetical protein VN892_06775, partial [Solirubrobacteraceae bacterium]|nr:hypothetical protein [Solirubrobacteraceae bacterium]